MDPSLLLSLLVVAVNLSLGFFILSKGGRNRLDRVFFGLLTISLSITIFSFVMLFHSPDIFWGRLINASGGLIGVFLVLFACALEEKTEIGLHKAVLYLLGLLSLLLPTFAFSPLTVKGGVFVDDLLRPEPGPLYSVAQVTLVCLVLWGMAKLISLYRRATGLLRTQIQYLILGLVSCLTVGVVVNFVLPRLGIVTFTILTPTSLILLTAPTAYSLLKYRLFDIRIAAQRGIALLALAAASPLVYFFIFQTLQQIIPREFPLLTTLAAAATFATIILSGVQVVRIVQQLTERIFFRGTYIYGETLDKITAILSRTYSVDDFCTTFTQTIANTFKTKHATFLLKDKKRKIFNPIYTAGIPDHGAFTFKEEDEFINYSKEKEKLFLVGEVAEKEHLSKKTIDRLKKQGVILCIPIKIKESLEGVICLGEKGSGDPYTTRDTSLLDVVSNQAGVALENAKLYSSLEEKVKERTKALEEAQKRELEEQKNVARLKDEFFFIATHELRTPVAAIGGFLNLVSAAEGYFPKDIQENLKLMGRANEHLKQLISDLLEISREEAGTLEIETAPYDLAPILKEVTNELSPLIKEKGLKLTVKVAKTPPVLCDPDKLKEVLMNLISNAIKYNRKRGSIDISAYRHPGEKLLVVEVNDTGVGIPKSKQEKVFQKFFRAVAKESREVLGTGLGLFITRMLVEKMGGKITFSSVEGKGSTFTFSLPLAQKKSQKR